MFQESRLLIGGYHIAVKTWGKPEAIPILALHGWLDNANSFDCLAPLLPDRQIIAFDFLGHGLSDHLQSQTIYHFVDAALFLSEIVKALHLSKFDIIGHSMGGAIACLYAALEKDAVRSLVILEGLGPLTEDVLPAVEQMRIYLKKRQLLNKEMRRLHPNFEAAVLARVRKGYIQEEAARILALRGVEAHQQGFRWRHDPKLLLPSPIHLTQEQVLGFLREIAAPMCFIQGEKGFHYDPVKMRLRFEAVKYLQKMKVPGGHHMHMEFPQETAAAILAFFAS